MSCNISSRHIANLFDHILVYTFIICVPSLGRKQFLQNWNHSNSLNLYRLLDTQVSNMNQRIRTDPHCFVSIIGPCASGKTQLVSNMLLNQDRIFRPSLTKFCIYTITINPTSISCLLIAHVRKFTLKSVRASIEQQ